MKIETCGFILGMAGTLLAAIASLLTDDDGSQVVYQQPYQQMIVDPQQPVYYPQIVRQPMIYNPPVYNPPVYNPPVYNPSIRPNNVANQACISYTPTTTNPWGTMAYISAIANTPYVPMQTYTSTPKYYCGTSYGIFGPQWDPPTATNYGVGNDIRPSPTGAPPGWTPPQFAPASAYW